MKGVDGGSFITQHNFKELSDMTLDELKEYIRERDFNIDISKDWNRNNLLSEVQGIEDGYDDEGVVPNDSDSLYND